MFRQVLVGVDERTGGRDAIALAKHLVAEDGELMLAHVQSEAPPRGSGEVLDAAEGEPSRDLLEKARMEAGVRASLVWTESRSVGRGLHELAERHDAELVVVGSRGTSLHGRVTVSDHTLGALNGAPCAVAIAPAGYGLRPAMMRKIGVGYDGSPESRYALAVARELATERGGTVSAFKAVTALLDPATLSALDRLVENAREQIAMLGDVEAHAAYGDPAEELALYGVSVDLLVVGSRGYGPLGRFVHGSTSQRLVLSARCPVVVLRRAGADLTHSGGANPDIAPSEPADG